MKIRNGFHFCGYCGIKIEVGSSLTVRYATPKLQTKKDEQSIGLAKVPCGSGQTNRAGVVAGGRVEEIGELSVGFGSSVGGP